MDDSDSATEMFSPAGRCRFVSTARDDVRDRVYRLLQHSATCNRSTCRPLTESPQIVNWQGRAYFVVLPLCRFGGTFRSIIHAVEQFGADVGWSSGCQYDGLLVNTAIPPREWFPMMPVEEWRGLVLKTEATCVKAANAGYRSYYWKREVARAVRTEARQRGRLRCNWCHTIHSWGAYKPGIYGGTVWLCDRLCEHEWACDQERRDRRHRKEGQWLSEARRLLIETRRLINSPEEMQRRRDLIRRREAWASRQGESRPGTTSPT